MPQPDNARLLFLILLIFWFASTPDNSPGLIAGPSLVKSRLARYRDAHGVLNSTAWGDFSPGVPPQDPADNTTGYLNLTGFRKEDGFLWEDLGRFKDRCEEWSKNAVGAPEAPKPVWQNATGVVSGPWARINASDVRYHSSYNLSEISPGIMWSGWSYDWARNISANDGKMLIRVDDHENGGTEPEKPLLSDVSLEPSAVRAREISATFSVEDLQGTASNFEMRLHGVHWPREGAILLTSTSPKFAGIFGLPHLTTRPEFFESSQALLNRTLEKVLRKKEARAFVDQSDPWSSTLDAPGEAWNPSPHCEYLVYMQMYPPSNDLLNVDPAFAGEPDVVTKAILNLEAELRFPQGAPHRGKPNLQMSAVVYSPDCAFFLETKGPPAFPAVDGQHLMGMKQEVFLYSVSTWLLGFGLVIFGQVQLLKLQMRETSTPSTLGRVSFYTASMMLLADGIIFSGSAAWTLSASTTLLPSLVVTCASFLSMTIGVFFLAEIFKVQEPEWRRQERERERRNAAAANNTNNTANPPASGDGATPATNTPPTAGNAPTVNPSANRDTARPPNPPPIIIPSDQDIDAEIAEVNNNSPRLPAPATAANPNVNNRNPGVALSNIFGRFIMAGICTLFLSLAAATWRPSLRAAYFNLLTFVYLSLWFPQIHRNVFRNCRQALSWPFVVGQSILRLLPISYFYLLQDNFAFAKPDYYTFAALVGWIWIQICVLVAQSVLGPRFGVPKGWLPEAWEYHPVLKEDNIEAGGLPIGLVSAPGSPTLERVRTGEEGREKKKHNTHVIDCAICREVLEVPVMKAGDDDPTAGGVAGVFARRMYMVTPCRHIFHSTCLEGWMRFRLQCPICREELPPL